MNRKTMILWILVILLMLGFAVTQTPQAEQEQAQPAEPPTSGEELRTDGWAWTQAHAGIDNAAILVGGPLQVQVNNVPGQDTAFWIFPGPRELDPHVFGTPDKPLGYAPPFPLYGVPLDLRGITEDGSSFTQTTQPTAFSNNWTGVQGASVGMTVVDVTATDAAVTQDQVDFQMRFSSPDGAHTYTVTAKQVLPHGTAHPFFGGVATNMLLHGFSGVGTPMMPTEFTYAAFWGVGTIERDGEVVNENQLIHVMVTEPVRGENYELMFDPNMPPEASDPQDKVLHLMMPPFRVVPGEQPPLQPQPVQTGVMVEGPEGQMEQPFFHVMINELDITGERLDEVPQLARAQAQQNAGQDESQEDQQNQDQQNQMNQEGQQAGQAQDQAAASGQQIYMNNCAQCHGENGQGGIGPAHAGNENLEDTKMVVNQILHGGGGMPGFADQLTAEEIAAVATFEKTSWGNDFGEVSVEQVQKIMDDQETQQPQQQRQQQAGWYTEEQASSGAAWYQEHCAQCHGNNLAGVARNPALRGDAFLQDFGNVQALFNFIRTKMPFPHPGELAEQTYLDITAYILRQNGFPTGDQPLTADQQLQQLRLTSEAAQVAERSDPEEPAEIDEPRSVNPFTGDQAAIEEGRQLYFDYKCAGCHGAEGGGSIGPSHTDNFWIYGAHDEAIFDVIRNGRIGMPPFENFEDEEIWKIVAFIRSLNQGLGEEF